MHPLHFAVQANNVKAVEKFKKHMLIENIDFFARDEENIELPQEYAAPSAPIYKMVQKIQMNIMAKKFLKVKSKNVKSQIMCQKNLTAN